MLNYAINIFINLFSDLLGWLIVLSVASILLITRTILKRRKLLRFLGLSTERPTFRVYFSSFDLKPGAISDLDGQPTMWRGLAVSAEEYLAIRDIENWISLLSHDSTFTESLYTYLTPQKYRTPQIRIEYLPSPRSYEDLKLTNCTALLIGGPLHNIGTKLYTSENMTTMVSLDWDLAVRVTKGKLAGRVLGPNITRNQFVAEFGKHQIDVAVLEKLEDVERHSTIFIASGAAINGTRAAINHLINNWEKIDQRHEQHDFSICLECPHDSVDPSGYLNSILLLELP
jgi:hypothetical protein